MALFEGYERREAKILATLKEYGISSVEECKRLYGLGIDCEYRILSVEEVKE